MLIRKLMVAVILVGMLLPQPVLNAAAAAPCDWVQFISDVTVPDGTVFAPGTPFVTTWRLKNIGTCTWTTSYRLVFSVGDAMGAPTSVNLPSAVISGQTADFSVNMTAPKVSGHYRGYWMLKNASGAIFGLGSTASSPFWVDINVQQTSTTIYDFVANAASAEWRSGAGVLPFPGTTGDSRGYAMKVDKPKLEDGSLDTLPGLLTAPQNTWNGYIQGTYPEFLVQPGDHLRTLVNCEFGASGCYVTFRIDYLTASGQQNTLWSWKETIDGLFYRADIDLSSLAGQKVKFILILLATGSPGGDRAIWGAPRILRGSGGTPGSPTPTPQVPPSATPTFLPTRCDQASFVSDVTVPDGTLFSPGTAFTKTWRLKNIGSCTWTNAYTLLFYNGTQMSAPAVVNFPRSILPGQTVDLTVNMVAPGSAGLYRGYWILRNASGAVFGIGRSATSPFWVEINVTGGPGGSNGYDFVANVCSAQWRSGAGTLPCPGAEGDARGFVLTSAAARLEDGTIASTPSLLVGPQNQYNGYIQGIYPAVSVQAGDRFQSTVGCSYYFPCYVTFRLDTLNADGSITNFWTWREKNEAMYYSANLDLSPLAGRSVRFILTILATGSAENDHALWGGAHILHTSQVPPTITPSVTASVPPPLSPTPTFTPQQTGVIVRGRVTLNGVGLANVKIFRSLAAYSGEQVATTDANGYYQSGFKYIPGDEMIKLWPELTGYSFDPAYYFWRHYHGFEDSTFNFTAAAAPPVTSTPTPGLTQTPTTLLGPYSVILLAANDSLNIRSGPGVSNPVVATFPVNETQIMRTGPSQMVNGSEWVEVRRPDGGIGWVNFNYLTETVSPAAFCSDTRIAALITQLKQAVSQSDGTLFAQLVSPKHGLNISYWRHGPAINFTPSSAQTIFIDTRVINWGAGPSGINDLGTFSQIVQPQLAAVLNASYQLYCNDPRSASMFVNPWPYLNLNYDSVYKPATPGVDLDWKNWITGFEYVNGQPYIFGMIHFIWEP